MEAPTEYIILRLFDGETNEVFVMFVDRFLTLQSKDELLKLTGKICLFKIKKNEEGASLLTCLKYKVLEEEL